MMIDVPRYARLRGLCVGDVLIFDAEHVGSVLSILGPHGVHLSTEKVDRFALFKVSQRKQPHPPARNS